MQVLFTSKIKGEITSFQPYSFQEVVEKTAELDAKWKKKNADPIALDFMISNEEGDKVYSGTYVVGSKETTNIYDHICQKLLQLPMKDQQQETERDIFLQKLTSHTPSPYQIDVTERLKENTEASSNWKQLSKRGKIFVSSLMSLFVIAIVISMTLANMVSSQSQDLEKMNQKLNSAKKVKNAYEMSLTEDMDEGVALLKKNQNRSEAEQEMLVYFLVMKKDYEEALKQTGKERISFLANQVMQVHGIGELKKFQEGYPSSIGAFEVAYHTENYKEAVAVKDVPMSSKLYKEKGLAYLKLDQLEEAKKMASEAKSDTLNEKINRYEELEKQLAKLNSRIKTEKKSEDKSKSKINSLEEQKDEIENQKENI